jgi:hypothetical protein
MPEKFKPRAFPPVFANLLFILMNRPALREDMGGSRAHIPISIYIKVQSTVKCPLCAAASEIILPV